MERQPTVEPESRRQAPSTVEVGRTPLSARASAVRPPRLHEAIGNQATQRMLRTAQRGVSGGGTPLPHATRAFMESLFGARLGAVRIHADDGAAQAAAHLDAAAFALGNHVAFHRGAFAPGTEDGLRLLAHEMVHVVQWQNGGRRAPQASGDTAARGSSLEREARAAVDVAARGTVARVHQAVGSAMPLSHPVYISRHGTAGFLNLANTFFTRWGYSPIKTGVDSIEEVVADLATQSSIGRVTLVSHAHPTNIMMGLFSGGRPHILKEDWQVDTLEEVPVLETHYVSGDTVGLLVDALQSDRVSRERLARVGSSTDPIVRQFLWWALEYENADRAGFALARKKRLKTLAERNMNAYRDTMLLASAIVAGFGGPATSERDFVLLRESIREATRGWTWTAPTGQAAIEAQLTGSPTLVINRVLRSRFFDDLDAVRGKMTSSTWLEIQGCRAGQDRDYLVQMQAFFAHGDVRPKVSAPDWFQFFGHYGFTPVADTPAALQAQWNRPQVRAALAYWYPILTGGALPDSPTRDTLGEFLRAPHALPMAFPGRPGNGRVLLLHGVAEEAFLRWLSRHSYRLTSVDEIRRALFTEETVAANVTHSVINWLQENRAAPTQRAFRPDPEYARHIVEVT